jgi:SAM-dependent methyltransferase
LKTVMKVLDVGVGTGLLAAQACILVGDTSLVTGVDPSPGMLAASKVPDTMVLIDGRYRLRGLAAEPPGTPVPLHHPACHCSQTTVRG